MKHALPSSMSEATRLVRSGRLAEAMALLQGGQGEAAAPAAPAQAGPSRGFAGRTIDATAETVAVSDAPAAPRAASAGGAGMAAAALAGLPDSVRGLLDRLGQGGLKTPFATPAAEPLPEGARFLAGSYRNRAGARAYKLYIPSGHRGQAVPLLVMLHGCTQSPDDFAAGTGMNALAEAQPFLVLYPAQDDAANPQRCWNWFSTADQTRDRGEPSLIAGMTREVMREHAVDPARVYVAGLSAGGAAAAIMGAAYPDLYAAVGVHSGLPCGAASDLPSALAAMRQGTTAAARSGSTGRLVPTIVFHGDQDRTVHPRNGDQVIAQARAAGTGLQATAAVQRGRAPGGLAYSRSLHANAGGRAVLEQWVVHGAAHAWSGGRPAGSYTEPRGPDATAEMLRFFLEHPHPAPARP